MPSESQVYRPRSVFTCLALGLFVVGASLALATCYSVLDGLEVSLWEDVQRSSESQLLGLLCVLGVYSPLMVVPALYLARRLRMLVRVDDQNLTVIDGPMSARVRWIDVVEVKQLRRLDSEGRTHDYGWKLLSSEGTDVYIHFAYGDPIAVALRTHLAGRGIRPQVQMLQDDDYADGTRKATAS